MSDWFAIVMLISGGLFAGGVVSIAWERVPAWRETELADFRSAFAHTLRRVDRLQPVLLVVFLLSTVGFAVSTGGSGRAAALAAVAALLIILAGSVAWLVPIQKRLVAARAEEPAEDLDRLRAQWLRGHLIRTVVALAALILAVVAASS
jgi:hypothetical protein